MFGKTFFLLCCFGVIFAIGKKSPSIIYYSGALHAHTHQDYGFWDPEKTVLMEIHIIRGVFII